MSMRRASALGLSLSLALVALVGCGGGTGNVSGKVYYQEVPMTGGQVVFQQEGKSITANIEPDGSYKALAVPSGQVKVAVFNAPPTAGEGSKAAAMMKGMQKTVSKEQAAVDPAVAAKAKAVKIPETYADPEKSGVTLTVKTGENPNQDIKLK
jgi:hypothetical protein